MLRPCHFLIWLTASAHAQWLPIEDTKLELLQSKEAGPYLSISYDLKAPGISEDSPAYVFIRYRPAAGESWSLVKSSFLQGAGHGIVKSPGTDKCTWWGVGEFGISELDQVDLKIRALAMAHVPGGEFRMRSVPSGGHDESRPRVDACQVPTFHIARNETTVGMYVDYLNEAGRTGAGWNVRMTERNRVGIERTAEGEFRALEGRALYPIC
jgi:formylglycine-generating enzyme required for sulfatase activity